MEATEVRRAYDGSQLSYRCLQACGWGELANLGYYPLWATPLLLGGLAHFQRRLARQAIRLLDPRPGQRVLDVATGMGWTAREISRSGATVLGIDLLPENVARARDRHGHRQRDGADGRVHFGVGDATRLPAEVDGVALESASVDRVLCLEAAFEFGPKGRRDFLAEAFRVLRPGGRLVLVDFAWPTDRPHEIADYDDGGLVRETWQFEEFEPLERYRRSAREVGFREARLLDWTALVTRRFVWIAWMMAMLCQYRLPRLVFALFRPGVFKLWNEDWAHLREVMRVHRKVQQASMYVALVLEKPEA
ncbi:MAG: methyltransferase domain-containing protein [Deltaproteobacteria bacterium]|nr:methyltransferase domain-containing protein [Deltaproteobacteria bacterium]MBW2414389.1 methyltransferase domain-containing protein [Deltaproteobacteria bacterium]